VRERYTTQNIAKLNYHSKQVVSHNDRQTGEAAKLQGLAKEIIKFKSIESVDDWIDADVGSAIFLKAISHRRIAAINIHEQ